MRLAVVASTSTVLPVLDAVAAMEELHLSAGWTGEESVRAWLDRHPEVETVPSWADLLVRSDVDAVLLAGITEEVVTAARRFAERRVPVWVVTDDPNGPANLFELTSIWQETPQAIRPIFLSGVASIARTALGQAQSEQVGPLWKVEFSRSIRGNVPGRLTRTEIDRWFLQDAEWLCRLVPGHRPPDNVPDADPETERAFTRVTMLTSGQAEETCLEASVTLSGDDVPEAVWTLSGTQGADCWQLTLRGDRGQVIAGTDGHHGWRIETPAGTESGDASPLLADLTTQLTQLASELKESDREPPAPSSPLPLSSSFSPPPGPPAWMQVVRLAEIGAAARKSLARKRTIPVHYEEASERSQFKSQMTAVGCGVLTWTLFGAVLLLMLAAVADPRDRELRSASAAGFVLQRGDFVEGRTELTAEGVTQLDRIARQWSAVSPVLLIEQSPDADLDRERVKWIGDHLEQSGARDPHARIVTRPLSGQWFETAMWVGWGIVFVPLAVFLAAQSLILLARPAE
jgi:hypothetical protein